MAGLSQMDKWRFGKTETKYEAPAFGKTIIRTTLHTTAQQSMQGDSLAHLQKFQHPSSRKLMETQTKGNH